MAIWLADKIGTIKNTSLDYPQLFWKKWAKGEKYVLPHSLLLGGREDAINAIKVVHPGSGVIHMVHRLD